MGVETGVLVGGLLLSAVGTGISVYGQQQQAANAERVAAYNAAITKQNADVNNQLAQYQANVNAQSAQAQYQAQQNNAIALERAADAQDIQNREKVRRMREQNEAFLAMQRAKYAKSGVTSEGSPLAVMADSAGKLQQQIQDSLYESDLQSTALRRKAADERFQSGFSLIDESVTRYEGAAAAVGNKIAYRQAGIDQMAANNQASGLRLASYGTILTGVDSGLDKYWRYKNPTKTVNYSYA